MRTWFIQGLKVAAILAFIGALVWFAVGGCMVGYRMHWAGECDQVTGTVIAYEATTRQSGPGDMPECQYAVFQYELPQTHESKTGRSSVASYPPAYAMGDKVQLLVHPDAPDEVKIDSYGELYALPTALMFLGALMLVAGLVFLYIFRKLSRAEA